MALSKKLTRWPPELVQPFVNRGSSHRRKSAACPNFDMAGLYRSPHNSGEEGGNSHVQITVFLPAFVTRRGGGEGRHPVFVVLVLCRLGTGMKWAQNACADNKALMQGGRVGILNASTAFWPSDSNPLISICFFYKYARR
jgi:hypothetical protein